MTKLTLVALGLTLFAIECALIFFVGIALYLGYVPRHARVIQTSALSSSGRPVAWSAARQRA